MEFLEQVAVREIEIPSLPKGEVFQGMSRRWLRERRRRKVGRAYDMALEIARVIPRGAGVIDIGCGNGFIAHHLSALLGTSVIGIDVTAKTDAPIDYRRYDGARIPLADNSVDAVCLCYVLHHVQDVVTLMGEVRRVLRPNGLAVIYEDIPQTVWDRFVCLTHNLQWRNRTGACTFRLPNEWQTFFRRFGFERICARQLSRARNLAHPVARGFYVFGARKCPDSDLTSSQSEF